MAPGLTRPEPAKPKIFCIGWHKTGTSSIGHALVQLGYSVLGCRLDMVHPLRRGDVTEVLELAGRFDALQDVPWAALFRELDRAYPDSRFILTERDEISWLVSASRHFAQTHIPLHEWLYGDGKLQGNENLYLERYRRHYSEVYEYFRDRPFDLLKIDLATGDSWQKLCDFLGHNIPNRPFPHSNKSPGRLVGSERVVEALRSRAPLWFRKAVFSSRQGLRDLLGRPDPRNVFNNMVENRKERETWREDGLR